MVSMGVHTMMVSVALAARITYLANAGVMVEGDGMQVLVDSLLRDSLDAYATHVPAVQEQLETGRAPFDKVRLALATHYHLDHWDAGAITRFLKNHPAARFISTPQGTGMLPYGQRLQVMPIWPEAGKVEKVSSSAPAVVEALPLRHGPTTQNLGYRILLGGVTVVHVGDTDATEENFRALAAAGAADVAVVPFWWLTNSQATAFFRERWKPRNVVAMHVGGGDLKSVPAVRSAWPGVWVCVQPGESRVF